MAGFFFFCYVTTVMDEFERSWIIEYIYVGFLVMRIFSGNR